MTTGEMKKEVGSGKLKVEDTIQGVLRDYPALRATMKLAGVEEEFYECCRTCVSQGELTAMEAYRKAKRGLALKGQMQTGMKRRVG